MYTWFVFFYTRQAKADYYIYQPPPTHPFLTLECRYMRNIPPKEPLHLQHDQMNGLLDQYRLALK